VVKPTPGELEILNVLWDRGPSTVRDVHSELERLRGTGYTTVLKLMQIMAEKGLVRREESGRAHIYRASVKQADAQKRAVNEMIETMFGGSAGQLALRALSGRRATKEELAELRSLLDKHEGRRQ
jgi:BlaI family transcriptional regulator, penicillinase repressor